MSLHKALSRELCSQAAWAGSLTSPDACREGSVVKNPPANAGDLGLIPWWERCPGEGNGNLLQFLAWEVPWTNLVGYSPRGHT